MIVKDTLLKTLGIGILVGGIVTGLSKYDFRDSSRDFGREMQYGDFKAYASRGGSGDNLRIHDPSLKTEDKVDPFVGIHAGEDPRYESEERGFRVIHVHPDLPRDHPLWNYLGSPDSLDKVFNEVEKNGTDITQ